jgi:hypothetical protein
MHKSFQRADRSTESPCHEDSHWALPVAQRGLCLLIVTNISRSCTWRDSFLRSEYQELYDFCILLLRRCLRKERTQLHHTRRINLAQLLNSSTRILFLCFLFFLFPFLGCFSFFSFFVIHSAAFAGYVVREGAHSLGATFCVGDVGEVCVEGSEVDR